MKEDKNFRAAVFAEFGRTFEFDRRLFSHAVRVNIVYCDALFQAGIVKRVEAERIKNGLQTLLKRADCYKDYFDEPNASDIYSFIETRLVQLIGESGEKLNIGRSREYQTLTAFRLWLRQEVNEISKNARDLQTVLVEAGERQKTAVFPVFAHSRKAQPILWAHWCLAYYEMFARDRDRLDEVWRRVNVSPLGAADLNGTSLEIDREEIAAALGFEGVSANSLDAAADYDFAVESIAAFSLLTIHISRLAQDLTAYNSPEYGFIKLLPETAPLLLQTEINEILETVRGKAGEIFGHQTTVQTLLKSLPLGIHKNSSEVIKAIFAAVDTVKSCQNIIRVIFENVRVNEAVALNAATQNCLKTAELTDYLVQRNVSVKTSREIVAKIAACAVSRRVNLDELSLEELQPFSLDIGSDVFQALSIEHSMAGKNKFGGTAPERVFEALEYAKENLERENEINGE